MNLKQDIVHTEKQWKKEVKDVEQKKRRDIIYRAGTKEGKEDPQNADRSPRDISPRDYAGGANKKRRGQRGGQRGQKQNDSQSPLPNRDGPRVTAEFNPNFQEALNQELMT